MITVRELDEINGSAGKEKEGVIEQCAADQNKLSIIHVVSSTKTITMAPFKKLTVLRNIVPSHGVITKDKKLQPSSPEKPEIYQRRKRMLLECKELFAALMRLPDKVLQKKLLDVINNHNPIEKKTVGIQTDPVVCQVLTVNDSQQEENLVDNASNGTKLTYSNLYKSSSLNNKYISTAEKCAIKRKRKRKVSLPQVNKESRSKQLAKMNKPKTANGNNISMPAVEIKQNKISSPKRRRINSFCISECSSDVVNIYEDTETNHAKEIEQSSYPLENGLLPIQDAVLRNQTRKLNMHILIWQTYKCIDLNDILTEEDEDLLQLAVLNSCDPTIVSLLLEKGLNPNSLDADTNSVVHLAILNDITVASLDHLMKHIDLKLLLTLNDDGYTPLHLAIRQDRYLLAERLINILDERLVKKMFYNRPVDELETDETILKKQFKDYYENVCLQMTIDEEIETCVVENHDLKQKLLQSGDRRSGNTALYFAIDNRYEHLVYFLLAHLTDPRSENLSGLDCKTYFSEFGKLLNLSLNIANTMDKVIKLLS